MKLKVNMEVEVSSIEEVTSFEIEIWIKDRLELNGEGFACLVNQINAKEFFV